MKADFTRTGELKNIASYPKWLQEVVKDCGEAKRKVVYHPLCKAMKDATLDIESTHRFLIGFFPVIEQSSFRSSWRRTL